MTSDQVGYITFVAQPLWTLWNRFVSPDADTEQLTNVKINLCVGHGIVWRSWRPLTILFSPGTTHRMMWESMVAKNTVYHMQPLPVSVVGR